MADRIAELREFVAQEDSGAVLELPYSTAVEMLEEIDELDNEYTNPENG